MSDQPAARHRRTKNRATLCPLRPGPWDGQPPFGKWHTNATVWALVWDRAEKSDLETVGQKLLGPRGQGDWVSGGIGCAAPVIPGLAA